MAVGQQVTGEPTDCLQPIRDVIADIAKTGGRHQSSALDGQEAEPSTVFILEHLLLLHL